MVCLKILGLLRYARVLCSHNWVLADDVIATGFGLPFGVAGREPLSVQLARHLPLVRQYGKRIRTDERLSALSVEGFVEYCGGHRISRVTCIYSSSIKIVVQGVTSVQSNHITATS